MSDKYNILGEEIKYSKQQITDMIRRDLYEKQHYERQWCEWCQGITPLINGQCGNISTHSEENKKIGKIIIEHKRYPQDQMELDQWIKEAAARG
jgi:hypothetical protein